MESCEVRVSGEGCLGKCQDHSVGKVEVEKEEDEEVDWGEAEEGQGNDEVGDLVWLLFSLSGPPNPGSPALGCGRLHHTLLSEGPSRVQAACGVYLLPTQQPETSGQQTPLEHGLVQHGNPLLDPLLQTQREQFYARHSQPESQTEWASLACHT